MFDTVLGLAVAAGLSTCASICLSPHGDGRASGRNGGRRRCLSQARAGRSKIRGQLIPSVFLPTRCVVERAIRGSASCGQ